MRRGGKKDGLCQPPEKHYTGSSDGWVPEGPAGTRADIERHLESLQGTGDQRVRIVVPGHGPGRVDDCQHHGNDWLGGYRQQVCPSLAPRIDANPGNPILGAARCVPRVQGEVLPDGSKDDQNLRDPARLGRESGDGVSAQGVLAVRLA